MSSKHVVACVVAGAVVVPLSAAAPASAAGGVGSAYGIYARGLLNMPPRPAVTAAAGPARLSFALPKNPVLNLALFTVTADRRRSSASVLNLSVADPELK